MNLKRAITFADFIGEFGEKGQGELRVWESSGSPSPIHSVSSLLSRQEARSFDSVVRECGLVALLILAPIIGLIPT